MLATTRFTVLLSLLFSDVRLHIPLHPRLYGIAYEICYPVVDLKGNRTWSLGICDAPGPTAQITTHDRVWPARQNCWISLVSGSESRLSRERGFLMQ